MKRQGTEFVWSERSHNVREFVELYYDRLPTIARIDELSADDSDQPEPEILSESVYWVHSVYMQPRILTRAEDGQFVSIPKKYPHKFHLVDGSDGSLNDSQTMTLSEIIASRSPDSSVRGTRIQMARGQRLEVSEETSCDIFRPLVVTAAYSEKYLLAIRLDAEGSTVGSELTAIPTYLPLDVTLPVATNGSDGGGRNQLEEFKTYLRHSTSAADYQENTEELLIFSEAPNEDEYELIIPSGLMTVYDSPTEGQQKVAIVNDLQSTSVETSKVTQPLRPERRHPGQVDIQAEPASQTTTGSGRFSSTSGLLKVDRLTEEEEEEEEDGKEEEKEEGKEEEEPIYEDFVPRFLKNAQVNVNRNSVDASFEVDKRQLPEQENHYESYTEISPPPTSEPGKTVPPLPTKRPSHRGRLGSSQTDLNSRDNIPAAKPPLTQTRSLLPDAPRTDAAFRHKPLSASTSCLAGHDLESTGYTSSTLDGKERSFGQTNAAAKGTFGSKKANPASQNSLENLDQNKVIFKSSWLRFRPFKRRSVDKGKTWGWKKNNDSTREEASRCHSLQKQKKSGDMSTQWNGLGQADHHQQTDEQSRSMSVQWNSLGQADHHQQTDEDGSPSGESYYDEVELSHLLSSLSNGGGDGKEREGACSRLLLEIADATRNVERTRPSGTDITSETNRRPGGSESGPRSRHDDTEPEPRTCGEVLSRPVSRRGETEAREVQLGNMTTESDFSANRDSGFINEEFCTSCPANSEKDYNGGREDECSHKVRATTNDADRQTSQLRLSEIPDDISTLSVQDVACCLRLLNLERYVDQFRDQHVDGSLLTCLDEDVLLQDFGLKRFDAIKLAKFARDGWRPKLDK